MTGDKKANEIQESTQDGKELLAKLIAEFYIQSAEIAAITVGKVIERLGLIHFDE